MKIIPLFKYRISDHLRGLAVFLVVFTLALTFIVIMSLSDNFGKTYVSAYEISTCITVFVFGICTIRDDLRLGIQNGINRRSVFFSDLLSTALISLLLAVVGELFMMAFAALTRRFTNITAGSLYQMLFAQGTDWLTVPLSAHLKSFLLTFTMLISANLAGGFISLMFYRLNKMWTTIVAIGGPIFLMWILPTILSYAGVHLGAAFAKLVDTPASLTLFFAVCAMTTAIVNRLLIRRAPIIPAAK